MVGRSVETEIPADTIRTSALSNVTRALRAGGRNVAIFALTSMLLASAVQSPLPKTVHITYHIAAMLRGTSECTTEYNWGGDAACTNGTPVPRTMTCHYVKQWQCIAVKAGQFRIKIYATESVLLKILP